MNLIQYTVHLEIRISIDRCSTVNTLVDSEATENYIAMMYTQKRDISIIQKSKCYSLELFNEQQKQMKKKIKFLSIIAQQHHEKIFFNVVELITHNIILRIS